MEVSQDNAEKIIKALSAFKTYKKPSTLPDRLRLSRKHLESVKKWRNMAKKKLKRGTFTSLTQLAAYLPLGESLDKPEPGISDEFKTLSDSTDLKTQSSPDKGSGSTSDLQEHSVLTRPVLTKSEEIDLQVEEFPDIFDVEKNFWDEDWEIEDEDDDDFFNFTSTSRRDSDVESFADQFGGVMENFAVKMQSSMERVFSKEVGYKAYKRAKEVFETWLEENKGDLSQESLEQREEQLQLYRDLVDVYEQMNEDDEENKKKRDMEKVSELNAKLSSFSGLLPKEVQDAQDEAAAELLAESLPEMMGVMVGGMSEMMTGFLEAVGERVEAESGTDQQDCSIL